MPKYKYEMINTNDLVQETARLCSCQDLLDLYFETEQVCSVCTRYDPIV